MSWFEEWSAANLGQWHYVLGYIVVMLIHNWPIFLSLILCFWFGIRLYQNPSRVRVGWFYTAMLFGLAYEYEKHVANELHTAVDFLMLFEISYLNDTIHFIVGPLINTVLLWAFLLMLLQSIRLSLAPRLTSKQLSLWLRRMRNDRYTDTGD